MELLIVTGQSGAGKTRVINALEDIGYYCVDNIPPALLGDFADLNYSPAARYSRTAIVMDARSGRMFRELPAALLGLFAGCVWDLHAAKSAGFNALFFMLLCFGVSAVMERYIRSTFVTHMLFALPAPFLYGLLYWLCFILIKGVDGGTNTLFTFYLPCALYTAVVAPILWFLLRPLRQRLNRKALQ